MSLRESRAGLEWRAWRAVCDARMAAVLLAACGCVLGVSSVNAQAVVPVHETNSNVRLMSAGEGRSVLDAALQVEEPEQGASDCSHVVNAIYANAGFAYTYASSFEIYAGNENFVRVKYPRTGDVIAWPGHVGIVVDAKEHSFYSLVRTGLEEQHYRSAYWRSRGTPRFYRLKVERGAELRAGKTPPVRRSTVERAQNSQADETEGTEQQGVDPNRPPTAVHETRAKIYGPPAPPVVADAAVVPKAEGGFEIPSSVIVTSGKKAPTREEVAEGISELSDAMGKALGVEEPLKAQRAVVIVENFSVKKVETKRDRGWAQLVVDSKVWIGGGTMQVKRRQETVRWELRRTESGWEAVTPADRAYVPHDVAVKNLAAQLARISASDEAAQHLDAALKQEVEIAGILNALLQNK